MKYKITFITALLVVLNYLNSKANDFNSFNYNFTRYAKIAAIDNELNQAKSFEEIKMVAIKMYTIVRNDLNDTILQKENDTIPPFSDATFTSWNKLWCGDIVTKSKVPESEMEFFEYLYEKRLWQMAGVIISKDDETTVKNKIQKWWNKYKTRCKCDSTTFNVPNGNILKFAISQNQPQFAEFLSDYELDINFLDPADGQNLLDYVNREIKKRYSDGSSNTTIAIYEKYRASLIKLGAKPGK
jgi:hypothetical protein